MKPEVLKRGFGYLLIAFLGLLFLYFNFLKSRWNYIVIHHSSTKVGSVKIFRNGHEERGGAWLFNDPMLYHLVIGNGNGAGNGELQLGQRWRRQQLGGGCCSLKSLGKVRSLSDFFRAYSDYYNFTGIHICLVGDFSRNIPTTEQLATLSSVVERLCLAYDIPPRCIVGHRDVQLAPTDCPGRHFPMQRFRRQMSRRLSLDLQSREVSVFTWKVRFINFWPILGIFFGEFYYSTALVVLNAALAFLFLKLARPLVRKKAAIPTEEIEKPFVHEEQTEYTPEQPEFDQTRFTETERGEPEEWSAVDFPGSEESTKAESHQD